MNETDADKEWDAITRAAMRGGAIEWEHVKGAYRLSVWTGGKRRTLTAKPNFDAAYGLCLRMARVPHAETVVSLFAAQTAGREG